MSLSDLPGYLRSASGELSLYYHEMVGNFGWLTQLVPQWALWVWTGLLATLIMLGVAFGGTRQRFVLVGAVRQRSRCPS